MWRILTALGAGLVFGVGLTLSEMINPAKVIGFLDIFGNWDPSLAFVMGGAVIVTAIGFYCVMRRAAPFLGGRFQLPTDTKIDGRLVVGSIMFGVGWGLSGLCPGPAVAAITLGSGQLWVFIAAMLAGMFIYEVLMPKKA